MHTWTSPLALAAAILVSAGCGGNEEPRSSATPAATAGSSGKRQVIEKYTTDFDARLSKKLFAGSPSGVDPADLVGTWEMKLNRTLGLLEVLAPDGGGPIMSIEKMEGDALVLTERECPKPFRVRATRTGDELKLTRVSGRCDETIDLLVARPWRAE